MRRIIALALVSSVIACGGPNDEPTLEPTLVSVPEVTGEDQQELTELRFEDVQAALDLDGDGRIDQADVRSIAECVEAGDAERCDVNGDGVADKVDLALVRMWVGWRQPRSAHVVAAFADSLNEAAAGEGPYATEDGLAMLADYDGDGNLAASDAAALADAISDDPVGRFDSNGDGLVGGDDVRALARAQSAAFFGQEATTDETEILLAAGVSTLTTAAWTGVLDTNFDGVVDRSDYCKVSNHPLQKNLYDAILSGADADAAFAASTPTLSLCRRDGRSIQRFPTGPKTPTEFLVEPSNLYLEALAGAPEGYVLRGPQDVALVGPLYKISTTPSDRPVNALRFPLDPGGGAVTLSIEVGGPDTEPDAQLLLPSSVVPLNIATPPGALIEAPAIKAYAFREAEIVARKAYFDKVEELEVDVRAIAEMCALQMSAEEAEELLRYMVSLDRALGDIEEFARFKRAILAARHNQLMTSHNTMMTASAAGWGEVGGMLTDQVFAETLIMVVEIFHELNLASALKNAVSKLAEDVLFPDKDLPVYLTGEGSLLTDALDGIVESDFLESFSEGIDSETASSELKAWVGDEGGGKAVERALEAMFEQAKGIPTKKQLGNLYLTIQENVAKGDKFTDGLASGLVWGIIGNIPKMVVNYQIRELLESDAQAVLSTQSLSDSNMRMMVADAAVADVAYTRSKLAALTNQLRGAIVGGGTTVDESAVEACSAALDSELQQAESVYDTDTREAWAVVDAFAMTDTVDGTYIDGSCYTGNAARDLEIAKMRGMLTSSPILDATTDSEVLGVLNANTAARENYVDAASTYEQECGGERVQLPDAGTLAEYTSELGVISAAQETLAAAESNAWQSYDACVGASPFQLSFAALTDELVWNSARSVVEKAPAIRTCLYISRANPEMVAVGSTLQLFGDGFVEDSLDPIQIVFQRDGSETVARVTEFHFAADPEMYIATTVPQLAAGTYAVWARQGPQGALVNSNPVPVDVLESQGGHLLVVGNGLFGVDSNDPAAPPVELAPSSAAPTAPSWSPDYSKVVYSDQIDGSLTVISPTGALLTHALPNYIRTYVYRRMTRVTTSAQQFDLSVGPVTPGTITLWWFTASGAEVSISDDGAGNLSGSGGTGTISGNTLAVVATEATLDGGEIHLDAVVDFENNNESLWHPRFSPDGTRIVYGSTVEAGEVWTMDVAGGSRQLVVGRTYNQWLAPVSPTFSPDGTRIAVQIEDFPAASDDRGVFVMELDGSFPTLVSGPPNGQRFGNAWAGVQPIVWTPMDKLLFQTDLKIWSVDPDGTNFTGILAADDYLTEDGRTFAVSPDGTKIAYRAESSTLGYTAEAIRIMNLDGSANAELLPPHGPTYTYSLAFSPDGNEVAYVVNSMAGGSEVHAVRVDNGMSRLLATFPPENSVEDISWAY